MCVCVCVWVGVLCLFLFLVGFFLGFFAYPRALYSSELLCLSKLSNKVSDC